MDKKNAYQGLIEHTNNWLFEMPENDLLMELLKMRFTVEEAAFLSRFPHFPHTLEELSQRLEIPADELEKIMKPMIFKGFIYKVHGKSTVRYSFTDPVFFFGRLPGWRGEDDEFNRKFAPLFNKYYDKHMGADFLGHPTKGLRAIPVAKTVDDSREIVPYEDILAYVEKENYYTVSTCPCRHDHNLDPANTPCPHEKEVCLHFGKLGKYIVDHGMGREITKKETLEILARCADAGLVHAISNTKFGMDTICNCCSCCCIFVRPIDLPEGAQREHHQPSSYMLSYDAEKCIVCGKCAKRCPVDAIEIRNRKNVPPPPDGKRLRLQDKKEWVYNPDFCIGCGVCVHKCATDAIKLVYRGQDADIPDSFSEAGKRMLAERKRDFSKVF
ncbi:MAG: 4Fe-4S binding protein [Desulfatibacillum sp.]|nr:4Fe-4S binding protein [Desulfatibacillum sp.]